MTCVMVCTLFQRLALDKTLWKDWLTVPQLDELVQLVGYEACVSVNWRVLWEDTAEPEWLPCVYRIRDLVDTWRISGVIPLFMAQIAMTDRTRKMFVHSGDKDNSSCDVEHHRHLRHCEGMHRSASNMEIFGFERSRKAENPIERYVAQKVGKLVSGMPRLRRLYCSHIMDIPTRILKDPRAFPLERIVIHQTDRRSLELLLVHHQDLPLDVSVGYFIPLVNYDFLDSIDSSAIVELKGLRPQVKFTRLSSLCMSVYDLVKHEF